MPVKILLFCFLVTGAAGSFGVASGQEPESGAKQAYFRAVADHFEVPMDEVEVLGEWGLASDEVPVVLFVSAQAGVSPDALVGMRKSGRGWSAVARRFGLESRAFHIVLPEEASLGLLSGAYEKFRSRPAREWGSIELEDQEIVSLVNLKVLSEQVGVPPLRVLRSREEHGSFVAGFMSLFGFLSLG
jgi:hypothetical protein